MTRKLCSFASFAQAIQASLRHSRDSTAVGIPRGDSDEESADPRIGQDNSRSLAPLGITNVRVMAGSPSKLCLGGDVHVPLTLRVWVLERFKPARTREA